MNWQKMFFINVIALLTLTGIVCVYILGGKEFTCLDIVSTIVLLLAGFMAIREIIKS